MLIYKFRNCLLYCLNFIVYEKGLVDVGLFNINEYKFYVRCFISQSINPDWSLILITIVFRISSCITNSLDRFQFATQI